MIRYLVDANIGQMAAATCAHPSLTRLRGRGPWATTVTGGHIQMQRGESPAWGEVKQGVGGVRYQLADPMPPVSAIKVEGRGHVAWVDLPGIRLPIPLAAYVPVSIGLDDQVEGPCDEYGMTAARLWDRWQDNDLPLTDRDLLAMCRLALMANTDLTAELIHAYGLLTTSTVPMIFAAATGCDPKKAADAADGG